MSASPAPAVPSAPAGPSASTDPSDPAVPSDPSPSERALAGAAIDPSKPIPTGDHEVAYARWPTDPVESRERRRRIDALDEEIATLAAHLAAADYRLLTKIREFDRWQGWHGQGFRNCAEWLSWRTHVAPGTARERVRVARALEHLPRLSEAMRTGELNYSCLRALTRVATPENEGKLLEVALVTPASGLERLVRQWKRCLRSEEELRADEEERHASRKLWLGPGANGSWRIHGELDPEVGAVLQKALEAAEERLYHQAASSEESSDASSDGADPADPSRETSRDARWADALGLVAEAALGEGLGDGETVVGRAERFQVVIRVAGETLRGEPLSVGDEPPEVAGGPHLTPGAARRLACDGSTVEIVHDTEGNALDVGRKSRRPPAAMRRALDHRDRHCRFPGCACRYCDAHHIHHWTRGGPTALENLVLLCPRHHRLFHEGGWRMERDDGGTVRFVRPDGRELPAVAERPPAPDRPIRVMERAHEGLGIGPDTATPDWDGRALDVDLALAWLWGDGWALRREDVRTTSSGAGSREAPAAAGSRPTVSQRTGNQHRRRVDVSGETPPLRDP